MALAEKRIFYSEKMVLKLGIVLMALAVFSGNNMSMKAYESGLVLKGYIEQNTTMFKEQSNDALFLLQKNWNESLNKKYKSNDINRIEEGIIYVQIVKNINGRKIKINVAEINRSINPDIEVAVQMTSNKMHSRARINKLGSKEEIIVAVNGTYFKQDTGTPLGALVINNEIISGPIYERVGLGIGKDFYTTARISFTGSLKAKGQEIKIDNINQPRMMFSNVLIYTPKWGSKSPKTIKPSKHVAVENNKVIDISNEPIKIPADGFVVSMPENLLSNLKIGDKLKAKYSLSPNWEKVNHVISGGPYLLKKGEIFIDITSEKLKAIAGRNPRTAVGYTKNNNLILVTVDGRKEGSSGVTLNELAKIMQDLGCYEAINLDGGSSTVMYLDGKIYSGSNIKASTSINNALVVRRKTV